MRRMKRIRVSVHYLEQVLRGKIAGISSNVPDDLSVRTIVHQVERDEFVFLCASESFHEVREGDFIPEFVAVYEKEPAS